VALLVFIIGIQQQGEHGKRRSLNPHTMKKKQTNKKQTNPRSNFALTKSPDPSISSSVFAVKFNNRCTMSNQKAFAQKYIIAPSFCPPSSNITGTALQLAPAYMP